VPLIATFEFSLRMRRGEYSFDAYRLGVLRPQFQATFSYSVVMALSPSSSACCSWCRPLSIGSACACRRLRPVVEFITLLPLVIPAIVIVFGYIRLYNSSSMAAVHRQRAGTDVLLTFGYVTLALPYMYRAVDTGMRTIDVGR
jgi:putative spermidine/putrescine transport system permease protein